MKTKMLSFNNNRKVYDYIKYLLVMYRLSV